MKLLFLTPQRPYPTYQGATIRNFHIIKALAQRHQVSLISFLEADQPADNGPLSDLCASIDLLPVPPRSLTRRLWQLVTTRRPDMAWRLWSADFARCLTDRLQSTPFDVVQIEGIEMAPYLPLIQRHAPQAKIIYDDHNAEWLLQARNFRTDLRNPRRWLAAGYSWVQTQRLKRYERQICQQAAAVVAVSEADKAALHQLDPSLSISVLPNGADLAAYQQFEGQPIPFDLVFTGKMDYRPNIDAMLWFADSVFPLITAQRPQTSLAIVGQRPHARLDRLREQAGITLTGFVDEILPYIAGAKIYIAPLRVGGGTRLKLVQAMAMGKAIVATTVGAEGYPIRSGREMILVDDPAEMAETLLDLLNDAPRRAELGQCAADFVAQHYDWAGLIPQLEQLYG